MEKGPHGTAWRALQQRPPVRAPVAAPHQTGRGRSRQLLKFMLLVVALGVVLNVACRMTFDIGHLREPSMLPTIEPGDFLVSQQWGLAPKTGRIVLVLRDERPGDPMVKRITATPGDQVRLMDTGKVHTLLADEYWVTGDNRFDSFDSRAFGPVRRHEIQGVIIFRTGRLRWIWD